MQDLSHLTGDLGTALIGGESMSAGNTVNDPVTSVGPAPGSQPVNRPMAVDKTDAPGLEVPGVSDHSTGVKAKSSPTSSDAIWKKV